MDLEKINSEYLQFKTELENAKSEKEAIAKLITRAKNDLTIYEASKSNAELDGDTAKAANFEKIIEARKEDLKKIEKKLIEKKVKMVEIQSQIDERVEQVKNNPELKDHLNEALVKKYSRKIKKIKEEKNVLGNKKETFLKIAELAENHESVKKNLIGMTNARKEIKALEAELKAISNPPIQGLVSYTNPARANEIMTKFLPIARGKYDKNKDLLIKYAKSKNVDVQESDLQELTSALAQNKGNINIKGTIERQVKGLNKQIKSYSVQILNFSDAINKIEKVDEKQNEGTKTVEESASAQHTKTTPVVTPVKEGFFRRLFTRFKEWRIRANQKALGFGEYEKQPLMPTTSEPISSPAPVTPNPVTNTRTEKKNEFKTSLKYDIVKEYAKEVVDDEFEKTKQAGIEAGIKAGRKQKSEPETEKDRDE